MKNGASSETMTVDEFVVSAAEILLEQVWPVFLFFEKPQLYIFHDFYLGGLPVRLLLTPTPLPFFSPGRYLISDNAPTDLHCTLKKDGEPSTLEGCYMVWFSGCQKLLFL